MFDRLERIEAKLDLLLDIALAEPAEHDCTTLDELRRKLKTGRTALTAAVAGASAQPGNPDTPPQHGA